MQSLIWLTSIVILSSATIGAAKPIVVGTKLTASDAEELNEFGGSVSISGTTAIVGAIGTDTLGGSSGTAYLFDLSNPDEITETKLYSPYPESSNLFGSAVGVSGTAAIVGEVRGTGGNGDRSGVAYLFPIPSNSQDEVRTLKSSDAEENDLFGTSIGISGTYAIVGARGDEDYTGAAYLYDFSDLDNIKETQLVASDGQESDQFGVSVAISGTTAIAGAYASDAHGKSSGAVYIYDFSDPEEIIETKLTPSDAVEGDGFGVSVAVSGTMALVATRLRANESIVSGSLYLFDISDLDDIKETKLLEADETFEDYPAVSVGISGTTAILGVAGDEGSAIYMLDFADLDDIKQTELVLDGRDMSEMHGAAVAISGKTSIVGDYIDGSGGAAYLYTTPSP